MRQPSDSGSWPPRRLRSWQLWTLPTRAWTYLLAVEAAAVLALTLAWSTSTPGSSRHGAVAVTLLVCATLALEGSLHVERRRERYGDAPYRDLANTWTFAGALLLPPAWAAAVVIGVYAGVWARLRHYQPYRWFASVACMTLGVLAASAAYDHLAGGPLTAGRPLNLAGLAAAAAAMLALSPLLLAVAIRLAVPGTSWRQTLGTGQDAAMEVATCCLAVFVALAALHALPLAALAVPVLFLLSHTLLVSQLQKAATTDAKTGLSNPGGWHELAERELARAAHRNEPLTVLLIDLDHFKDVNDTHGHLAGDAVLRSVARALREEVRSADLVEVVGRWGGEEFIALLPGTDPTAGTRIAERLRARVAALQTPHPDRPETLIRVTASIGVATYPTPADSLGTLLTVADTALYAAKRAGRHRVAVNTGPTPARRPPAHVDGRR